ncbi:MAG: helix-turn-helix domain-containing protein [Clostridiales bacterium]|nr:helix-turn-helix domain-containing protein [Clostridiales bacterium]
MNVLHTDNYIAKDEGISIRLDDHPFKGGQHSHEFMELVLVIEGKAEHIVNNERTLVKKGDVFIIDMGAPHYYLRADSDCVILNCLFPPSFLERLSFDGTDFGDFAIKIFTDSISSSLPYPIVKSNRSKQIARLLFDMKEEYDKKQDGYVKVVCSYLTIVLTLFCRNSYVPVESNRFLVDEIKRMLSTSTGDISVEKISDALFFSPSYVSKIYKKFTGEDLSALIRKKRITLAGKMLEETDLSVEIIMRKVGYKDKKNFYDIFEKEYALTPTAYRKKNKCTND